MLYVVLYDYGPYDGGITIVYVSKSRRKAEQFLVANNKNFIGLEIRELPLDTEVKFS